MGNGGGGTFLGWRGVQSLGGRAGAINYLPSGDMGEGARANQKGLIFDGNPTAYGGRWWYTCFDCPSAAVPRVTFAQYPSSMPSFSRRLHNARHTHTVPLQHRDSCTSVSMILFFSTRYYNAILVPYNVHKLAVAR